MQKVISITASNAGRWLASAPLGLPVELWLGLGLGLGVVVGDVPGDDEDLLGELVDWGLDWDWDWVWLAALAEALERALGQNWVLKAWRPGFFWGGGMVLVCLGGEGEKARRGLRARSALVHEVVPMHGMTAATMMSLLVVHWQT